MNRNLLTFLAVALFASSGCASYLPAIPDTGAEATGEPLHVQIETKSYTYTTHEKAGEVVYKDRSGQQVGSSDVYVDKKHTGHYDVWYPMQGQKTVDEADFYRISGQTATADDIIKKRKRAKTINRVGVIGGGTALAGGLALMYVRLFTYKPTSTTAKPSYGMLYAASGLAITGAIGLGVGYLAAKKLHKGYHFTDQRDAANAAADYNKTLGGEALNGTPISYLRR